MYLNSTDCEVLKEICRECSDEYCSECMKEHCKNFCSANDIPAVCDDCDIKERLNCIYCNQYDLTDKLGCADCEDCRNTCAQCQDVKDCELR